MKKLIFLSALALAVAPGVPVLAGSAALTAPVETQDGAVVGSVEKDLSVFRGIPFAAPPVRENRWRDPQPVRPWSGALIADRYSPMCMQSLRPKNSVFYTGEEATSEDCLYLNLWTSSEAKKGDKRPVMVFIYGGGTVKLTCRRSTCAIFQHDPSHS